MIAVGCLPVEILNSIFEHLVQPEPSADCLYAQPRFDITESKKSYLKSASQVCTRWRVLVQPALFRHARLIIRRNEWDLRDGWPPGFYAFLTFLRDRDLARSVETFTLLVGESNESDHDDTIDYTDSVRNRWQELLEIIHPSRLTIVAPPPVLGLLTGIPITVDVRPSFHMPYHILSLGRTVPRQNAPPPDHPAPEVPTLLTLRPWESLLLNEGSFLRAYSDPRYPDNHIVIEPPSILPAFVAPASALPPPSLTSLAYVAIYPFIWHVEHLTYLFPQLRRLYVQIVPQDDVAPDPMMTSRVDWLTLRFSTEESYRRLLIEVATPGHLANMEEIVIDDVNLDKTQWAEYVLQLLEADEVPWREDPRRRGILVKALS